MSESAARLRKALLDIGASQVTGAGTGPSDGLTYETRGLVVTLLSEYGAWRVLLGPTGSSAFPAAFWLEALDGSSFAPDPAVTPGDIDRLADRLPEVVERHADVLSIVEEMGVQYARAMRDRLT